MVRAPVLHSQLTSERLWSWPLIWSTALTRPTVATYAGLLAQPRLVTQVAYRWLLLAGAISGTLMAAVAALGGLAQPGDSSLLWAVPLYILLVLSSWMLFVGCTQWCAQPFRGYGTYAELFYAFATFSAPLTVMTTLLSLLPNHGLATFCLYGYWILLYIRAIQAVHRVAWQQATVILLLALGLLALVAGSLAVGLGYLLL